VAGEDDAERQADMAATAYNGYTFDGFHGPTILAGIADFEGRGAGEKSRRLKP
jgi:hypothetical protein